MSNPNFETVKEYMKGQDELVVKKFYEKYSAQGWFIGCHKIVDWKILAEQYIKGLLSYEKFRKL